MASDPSRLERRSRLMAVVAVSLAIVAIALELAYTVGTFVFGVVHRVF